MPENRQAMEDMDEIYSRTLMGEIAYQIYLWHKDKCIVYEFDEEAMQFFMIIVEKYNAQFNLKWSCKSKHLLQVHTRNAEIHLRTCPFQYMTLFTACVCLSVCLCVCLCGCVCVSVCVIQR